MLLVWDLGVSSLVLVVCLVFPVVGLLIRRQWRRAASRREDVRRLLIIAQEEAARAELEASAEYGYGTIPAPDVYCCAVCYFPTKTRCGRCKAVRYCSGKCQIIHWRQGHKDECHPPIITNKIDHEESNSGSKAVGKDLGNAQHDKLEAESWQHAQPVATLSGDSTSSDTTSPPEDSHGNIADIKAELLVDKEETNSIAETSGSSFSGFSSSRSNDSFDDVSVCESISSFDSERSESPLDHDITVEALETTYSPDAVALPHPLSPKFTHLVESVDNSTNLNKLNQSKPLVGIEGSPRASQCLPSASSSFWGRSLECSESVSDAHDDSALAKSIEAVDDDLSDSGSSVLLSFNSSEKTSPAHAKVCDVKDAVSDEAAMENDQPNDRVTVSETSCEVSAKSISCTRASPSKEPKTLPSSASSSFDLSSGFTRVSSCASDLDVTNSSFLDSQKSNDVVKDPYSASWPLKVREVKDLSSKGSDADIPTRAMEHSAVSAKSWKAAESEARSVFTLHATSSANGRNGMKTSVLKVVDQFKRSKSSNHYLAVGGSEVTKKHGDRGLFSYELFVKLYNWNKVELQPCGLINCGNSCYANAVLQCLMFTPPLTAYFLQGFHSRACAKKEWCFSCEFENLIFKANERKSPLSPIRVLSQLQNIGIQLGNGREEDAHEFLRFAIDTMQSVCIKEAGYDTSHAAEREETTLVGLTFGGYLRSKIKCLKCQGKSERHEKMMDLTVEIEGDISTLEEALRRFTRTEILDGENKYKCGRCRSYERAKKKLKILEAPNVLTIALKRFQSGKFGKLNKSIKFPETLDLAPYVCGRSDKSHVYRLYGVVVHLDIMNAAFSGHYVCYVKNAHKKWYKVDDSTVTALDVERVLTKGAYMLFYARASPRPPRSICSKTIPSDQKSKALLSKPNAKNTESLSRSLSTNPSSVRIGNSPDGQPTSLQSFYSKFHRLQRILEEDSSSDSSSLFSNNSDECSCSTASSTRGDTTSTDEFADFIFGDLGQFYKNSPTSETPSSSASSFYTKAGVPETYLEGNRNNDGFLHSNNCKRTLLGSSSSSSNYSNGSCKKADTERLLGRADALRPDEPLRKPKSERT